MKVTLKVGAVVSTRFAEAFRKLGEDDIPVRERFRLALSAPTVDAVVKAFQKEQASLVEKYGTLESEQLKLALGSLPEGDPERVRVEKRLANIARTSDRWVISAGDKEKLDKFNAEFATLVEQEVELPQFDSRIKLSENSKLTAEDMALLIGLVEV